MSERELKLFQDLNVVLENVHVANQLIDKHDIESLEDVMVNISQMEQKLSILPPKLEQAG